MLTIHVSPTGTLTAAGTAADPVGDLHAALDVLRAHREVGELATLLLAGGRYALTRPLALGPEDSHTTFAAADPDDRPVLDGAVALTGWAETDLAGRAVWMADAPSDTARSLFVDGRRAPRPRYPRGGFLRITSQPDVDLAAGMTVGLFDGADRFHYADGDAWPFHDLDRVEAVVPHYWVQERMPLADVDTERRLVTTRRRSIFVLRDDMARRFARYYFDNVFEAFGETPGEWYLDRTTRRVLYVPTPDDVRDTFTAHLPVACQLVVAHGCRDLTFDHLVFRHTDWRQPNRDGRAFGIPEDADIPVGMEFASEPQAAAFVEGAIELRGTQGCAVVDCVVEHVGGYAIALEDGGRETKVTGNVLRDLGAGGVKVTGDAEGAGGNTIVDNDIGRAGLVFPQSVGILLQHSAGNLVARNHLHDLPYSGISSGWVWGYGDNPSRDNVIEANHIHHLGQDLLLNDMGGVYLLGRQPGTIVRGNWIHDVECVNYGGWGIYLDEGSSDVLVEGNLVHDVSSQCFHQHYGRSNVVRGNVFAFGRQGQVSITRVEPHTSFTFTRNILLGDGVPAFASHTAASSVRDYGIDSDLNLYWDISSVPMVAGDGARDEDARWLLTGPISFDEWRDLGHDAHSIIADPMFTDVSARDFTLRPDSPARQWGSPVYRAEPTRGWPASARGPRGQALGRRLGA